MQSCIFCPQRSSHGVIGSGLKQGSRRFRRIVGASWQIRSSAVNWLETLQNHSKSVECQTEPWRHVNNVFELYEFDYMLIGLSSLSHGETNILFIFIGPNHQLPFGAFLSTQKDGFGKVSSSLGSAVGSAFQQLGAQGLSGLQIDEALFQQHVTSRLILG